MDLSSILFILQIIVHFRFPCTKKYHRIHVQIIDTSKPIKDKKASKIDTFFLKPQASNFSKKLLREK